MMIVGRRWLVFDARSKAYTHAFSLLLLLLLLLFDDGDDDCHSVRNSQ